MAEELQTNSCVELKPNIKRTDHEGEVKTDFLKYLSSSDCDIQRICRLCLSVVRGSGMVPLFSTSEHVNLLTPLSLEITPDSELPSQSCSQCIDMLVQFNEFKIKCQQSNYTIKSVLKGEYIKDEPSELEILLESNIDNDFEEAACIKDEDTHYQSNVKDEADEQKINIDVKSKTREKKKSKYHVTNSSQSLGILKQLKDTVIANDCVYSCSICEKSFPKPKALKLHMKLGHSADKTIKCTNSKCKEIFISEHDYELHTALHVKGGKWSCKECKKEYKSKTSLQRHIRRHMEVKKYKCDLCDKTFTELYAVYRHRRVHTGECLEKKHKCTTCDKRFSERAALRVHTRSHTGERPWPCAECDKSFTSRRLLTSHMLTHSQLKPHACIYCGIGFRHESTRNAHHRTHTGEKPFVCTECGRAFMQSTNLTQHMRTHTGEKPYTCSRCGHKFSSSSALRAHERTHTGAKPYSCSVCGKRFCRSDLSAHMRLHTGERPFECNACSRRFTTRARLKEHSIVMHTGDKPFECAQCHERFATKSHLVKHIKTHAKNTKRKENQKMSMIRVLPMPMANETPSLLADNIIVSDEKTECAEEIVISQQDSADINSNSELNLVPIEMRGMQEDNESKTELILVESLQDNYQENVVLTESGINTYLSGLNQMNIVTVSEEEMRIAASNATLDGACVKLYQLDQSLVQIHRSGGQVTISKITSKMTANFE